MGDEKGAGRRQPRPAELAVDAVGLFGGERELALDPARGFVQEDKVRGIVILDKEHAVRAVRLGGVDFRAGRSIIIPDDLFVPVDFGDAKLVGKENIPVGLQDGIADFTPAGMSIGPDDVATAHDEQAFLFGFARINEVMLRQALAGQSGGRVCKAVRGRGRRGDGIRRCAKSVRGDG